MRELTVLVVMCAIWGFHFVVIKLVVAEIPPLFYAAMRMSLVAVLMAPFLRWRSGKMAPVLVAGLCLGAFNYAFLFNGIRHATASASAIAVELFVPFATIMSVFFLGEKVGWRRIAGITLAFAGVSIIALGKGDARVGFGVGLVACAAFVEAIGAVLVKRAKGFKPYELLAWFAMVGSCFLWSATITFEKGQADALRAADPGLTAGAIVYSAVGASVFAHTAYYWLLQRLPVSQVAPSALLTTLLAVAFSAVILNEPLTVRFLIGGVMALTGVGIVLLRAPKSPIVETVAGETVAISPMLGGGSLAAEDPAAPGAAFEEKP